MDIASEGEHATRFVWMKPLCVGSLRFRRFNVRNPTLRLTTVAVNVGRLGNLRLSECFVIPAMDEAGVQLDAIR